MNEASLSSFCHGISPLLQLVGELLLVFKLVVPILLIVICILDVAKAILSSKSDENKNRLKNFFYRVLFAVLLFFIPALFMLFFSFNPEFTAARDNSGLDYDVCYDCLFYPYKDECKTAVEIAHYEFE